MGCAGSHFISKAGEGLTPSYHINIHDTWNRARCISKNNWISKQIYH